MQEFSSQFQESFYLLWLIAVGIVGDRATAEDVVQEAALIAFQKRDQFTPGTSFVAWMAQIVRNVARNRARFERTRRTSALDEVLLAQATGSATRMGSPLGATEPESGDGPGIDGRIVSALESVGETARACLLLRTIGEMEYSRIAELLNIPEGTAMSHVHRTRRQLRERLADLSPSRASEAIP